jgi:hypothetical protein
MAIPLRDTQTHTDAVVNIAAVTGVRHQIESIHFSLTGGTPASTLKIESPSGTVLFQQAFAAAGSWNIPFSGSGLLGALSQALIVTLTDGGASIVGNLNVLQRGT